MTGIVLNLGARGGGISVVADGDAYVLRESTETYEVDFDTKNRVIALNNRYFLEDFV
jgi:hypothetical protein